ncbi:FA complementation group M isoform X2 [Oratosquilla oratoria]|uniref:FA complementation group M isoform X2 n=1 Tax=Oratosquilla oratoria TaxID=337810 RepID=UPI003F777CB6
MDKEKQITLFSSWTHQKKSDDDSSYAQPMKDQMWGDDEILAQVLEQSLREYQSTQNSSHGEGPSHHRNTTDTEEEYGIESTPVLPPCHPLETLPGFDLDAGRTWIYPVNYPVRQYQYDIVHKSLFLNTLVALPTGLGKTFIAAVLMYNFYRWYPQGKVIFMAPTKPLVTQQVEACYNVMGIPQADTAEMTGTMNPTNRIGAWKAKRMFFLTPQVLTNDLNRGACPTANVCCIVLDEAHRAQGNHAYCQVVRELSGYGAKFRILALSATPGTDIKSVQQVIQNLQISHIELRSEDSPDIAPYTHARNIEKIVVDLGTELKRIKEYYLAIVRVHVKRLIDWRAVYTRDETTLSKFQILKAREAFRQNPPDSLPRYLYGVVEGEFALCMTLYHALELLQLHGAKSFHSFLKGTLSSDKGNNRARGELLRNSDFIQLMDYVEKKFSPEEHVNASTSHGSPGLDSKFSSPNSSKAKPGNPYVASHPKLEKLRNIILEHFKKFAREDQSTRVMIFSQYRDSVKEITDMLQDYQPQVKAMSFVGQSSVGRGARGFSQKEQLKVVKRFREGGYNTLVSTCVGEEGLDIGEVDLIICFDAPKSPIRLVQRMGRTGRKREGSIVVLVTKGKEEQTYNQSQYQKKTIHSALANGQILKKYLYPRSERMIPKGVQPVCHKLIMKVDAWDEKAGKGKKRKYASESCGSLFSSVQSGKGKRKSIASVQGNYLTHEEWNWYKENLEVSKDEVKVLPASCMIALGDVKESHGSCQIQLGEYQPWQTTHQPSHLISHSLKSQHLVELTEFMDLMVTLGPDDDSYGLEMAPFFDDKFLGGENEVAKDAGTPQKNSSPVISRAKRGRKKGMKMKGIQRRIDEVLSQHKKQKTCKDSTQEKESNESNYSNSNQRFKNALSKFACNQEEEKDFEEVNSNSKPLMSCSSEKEQKEVCQSSQRSCSDGQDFQDTAEVVTVCSISQTMCSKDLQTGHLEHVNRSQKSPKSKTEKGLHDSSSHKKENQPWEVMSDLHGLPKVLTRDSTLQIRTPPPDFESPNLDYSEERSYDIDMIEECERQHCVKMNNNLEKVGIAPFWDSLGSCSPLHETPEREVSATKNALQGKENSMDELPDLMQPSPKIMSKSYSRKFSVSLASIKINPNVKCSNSVNSPLKIGSQSSSKLLQVDKSPEDSKIESKTSCLSPISPILPTTYRKPFKSNQIQCSSTPKPSVRQLFRGVSSNLDFVQKDNEFEMPSPIIKGHLAPSIAENTKKARRSLIHGTVSDDCHLIPSSLNQKSQISSKLSRFSAEPTSDVECTLSTLCKDQKISSLHIKPLSSESHEPKTIDAEGYNSNEDLFADDFNIDLTAIERENVEQAKGSLSNACELISSKENLPNVRSERNASVFPHLRENEGAPLDVSGISKEVEPVHDNLAVNFELSLGDDLFDNFDYDKDGKPLEEQGITDQDKQVLGMKESMKGGCYPGREKPTKGQTENHSLLTVTQIMDLVNEPSFQKQNEDCEFQNKKVRRNLSLSEKSIGAPEELVKPNAEPISTGSQRVTKNLQVTSDKEVSTDSELHNSGSCSESLLKSPEKRDENVLIVKELPHVGNGLNFSLLDDFGEVEIMKEAPPMQGTAGFEISSEYFGGSPKIAEPKSKLFGTESMSQSLLLDIEMNKNLKWEDVAKKQATKTDTKLSQSLLHSDDDSPLRFTTKRKITLMSSDEESPKFKRKKLQCRIIHDSSAEGESIGSKDKSNSLCESTISSENRNDTTDKSDVKAISPKVNTVKEAIFFSDDEEGVFDTKKTKVYKRRKEVSDRPGRWQKRTKKYKKRPNHYICEEAELSVKSGEEVSEDEEDNSEPNTSDESFVDDNTELTQDEKIDMKAVYLQSVKSPEGLQNKRSVGDAYLDVLSQPDVDDFCSDNDADSFVVSNDCIEYDTEYMGDDMLAEDTIMQKAAAEDLDYKKVGTGTGKGKRRRIILQDSTDCTSEEEANHSSINVKPKGNNFLILVDSCEVNGGGSQVISTLRIKYKACTEVVQLGHADYAVSRRMGVWRQSLSAFSSSSNKTMLISKVQKMLELFERPVLIVEKEPTRPNETPKTMTRTKYLDSILCAFCQVGQMKVLHSTGHSETASLVWELAKVERTKGYHLSISATVVSKLSQIINFYKCLPQISYASAVFLTYTFPNVADFMSCSVIQLQQKTGWSRQRVVAVHQFLHRIFREDMLPS